jgi:hypothetical protein
MSIRPHPLYHHPQSLSQIPADSWALDLLGLGWQLQLTTPGPCVHAG